MASDSLTSHQLHHQGIWLALRGNLIVKQPCPAGSERSRSVCQEIDSPGSSPRPIAMVLSESLPSLGFLSLLRKWAIGLCSPWSLPSFLSSEIDYISQLYADIIPTQTS